jgi:hypothetical protein
MENFLLRTRQQGGLHLGKVYEMSYRTTRLNIRFRTIELMQSHSCEKQPHTYL